MMRTALTIAGSDSSGGAGIQADIKTMTANGVFATCAVTALTAQNTTGVTDILESTPHFLEEQLDAVFTDIFPDAVKIGMVSSAALIAVIADKLRRYDAKHIVVDPVMVATSGSRLMQHDALACFEQELLPMATLLTPNVPEAELLSGQAIDAHEAMEAAAQAILAKGCQAVLIKGGHLEGATKADRLFTAEGNIANYQAASVDTRNTHGTGCTLSSAITARLALGDSLIEAIRQAKEYLTEALRQGADVTIGHGHGPVNHFYQPQSLQIHP